MATRKVFKVMATHKVFVYGSLQRGQPNYTLLKDKDPGPIDRQVSWSRPNS